VRLFYEVEGGPPIPLPGGGAALVAFMSFAVARGFGAQHAFIALADRLHEAHGLRLGPLTTFYEARPEDAEDEEKLALAWQPAAPLIDSLSALCGLLERDDQAAMLARRAGAETLGRDAGCMAAALVPARAAGRRVRLSYEL
jgi:hypothetical protein